MKEMTVASVTGNVSSHRAAGWTELCGNPDCRSGWLQVWRSRSGPRFEGRWACSAGCMERIVAGAIRGQIESWDRSPAERALRMPLGLILLSRGWITRQELQEALAAQRCASTGRIGEWLSQLHGVSQETIAKALAMQWNCAVLLSQTPGLELASAILPPFLERRYELALARQGSDTALYLVGKCRAEQAAARAVEHMLGVPVRAAFLEDQAWPRTDADAEYKSEVLPPGPDGVAAHICELIERSRSGDARLVRIHDHLWLRMWTAARRRRSMQVRDVVLPLRMSEHRDGLLRVG